MDWWVITLDGPHAGKLGYLVRSTTMDGMPIGVFFADGSPVPDQPGYGYTTVATNAPAPAWSGSISDFPAPAAAVLPPSAITAAEYILLFTPAETAAIRASADLVVQQFLLAVEVAQSVDLADPHVLLGLQYLVSIGLLTAGREAAIAGNIPPGA